MTEQEILLQITELQEIASAASRACIRYMDKDNPQTSKYLEALREHTKATSEINKLKNLLKEKV